MFKVENISTIVDKRLNIETNYVDTAFFHGENEQCVDTAFFHGEGHGLL